MPNSGKSNVQHPLFAISTKRWIRLLAANGGVDAGFRARAAFITVMSVATSPGRLMFRLRYGQKIRETKVAHPPVFIIGHWRSGTTYLHEVMSQDP